MKFDLISTFNENGKLHSFQGEPAEKHFSNSKSWYLNGQPHREDGPAFDYSSKYFYPLWYLNGFLFEAIHSPPENYLEALEEMGIKFVRGSDEV
jgi:hypothetical protein